jgi:hypothetical protein
VLARAAFFPFSTPQGTLDPVDETPPAGSGDGGQFDFPLMTLISH